MRDNIKKFNVLLMASSKNVGLTFNLSRLAIALKRFGNKVIVVSEPNEEENGLFSELKRNEVEVHTLHGVDDLSIKRTIDVAKTLGRIVNHNDVHIIHAQGIRHLLVAFIALKFFSRKRGVKIVVTVNTLLAGSHYETGVLLIESILLNIFADLTIAVANNINKKLVSIGLHEKKIVTIPNGIDLDLFDSVMQKGNSIDTLPLHFISTSDIVLGYFARLVPLKGHRYLIEGISQVSKKFPNVKLVIAGNGPLMGELRKQSKDLRIEEKIIFTGWLNHTQIYQLLNIVDIYVFPSLGELFPFAILEAIAASKPIVATNVGGVSDAVIDGVNGYLVPPKDPNSMSKAILTLIEEPNKARLMGMEGRRILEQEFSMDIIARKLNDVYELALKRKISN